MTCWRCGRVECADWCSDGTPGDCNHCGGNPCRWWCLGEDETYIHVGVSKDQATWGTFPSLIGTGV